MSVPATPPSTPVVRVKRRRSQSPVGALLVHLSSKKRKSSDEVVGATAAKSVKLERALFKFAATVEGADHAEAVKAIKQPRDHKLDPKNPLNRQKKPPLASPEKSKIQRYKVVASKRNVEEEASSSDSESDRLFKLVDVVQEGQEQHEEEEKKSSKNDDQITCNGVPLITVGGDYVYDLYHQDDEQVEMSEMDIVDIELLDCQEFDVWGRRHEQEMGGEDSDSNDEDNWRNDYPDEDDFCEPHRGEDDFELGLENMKFDEDDDEDDVVGADGGEDQLVYSKFQTDADKHGLDYARYKKKVLMNFMKDEADDEDEDDDDDDINLVDEY